MDSNLIGKDRVFISTFQRTDELIDKNVTEFDDREYEDKIYTIYAIYSMSGHEVQRVSAKQLRTRSMVQFVAGVNVPAGIIKNVPDLMIHSDKIILNCDETTVRFVVDNICIDEVKNTELYYSILSQFKGAEETQINIYSSSFNRELHDTYIELGALEKVKYKFRKYIKTPIYVGRLGKVSVRENNIAFKSIILQNIYSMNKDELQAVIINDSLNAVGFKLKNDITFSITMPKEKYLQERTALGIKAPYRVKTDSDDEEDGVIVV